jgi:hypothetical protein
MALRSPAGFISAFFDPLKNPDAPTSPAATAGDASAVVTFTAPANVGGSAITAYYAVSNPGQVTSAAATSPVTVTGLTNGTSYTFNVWALNSYGPGVWSAATGSVTPLSPRALILARNGTPSDSIDYFNMSSTGNSSSFGTLASGQGYDNAGMSSASRAVVAGGYEGGGSSGVISYVEIYTLGNSTSFGTLAIPRRRPAGVSNTTRGVLAGGDNSSSTSTSNMAYITIATAGNGTSFGNLSQANGLSGLGGCESSTRGVFMNGNIPFVGGVSTIQYITIATTGNTTFFGSMAVSLSGNSACSSSTRGLSAGDGGGSSLISYITIASTGNSTTFGNLNIASGYMGATSSSIYGFWAGGSSTFTSAIRYVTISSTGNSVSWGNLTNTAFTTGCSSAHGGLQ